MPAQTRRHLLARTLPALALAALLPACGQPSATPTGTPLRQRGAPPAGTPSPATPRAIAAASPSAVATAPLATATAPPTPTPTVSSAHPIYLGDGDCFSSGYRYNPSPAPGDPYIGGAIAETAAVAFSERVRNAKLIVLGTVRDILPARWTTPDGQRPANPHRSTTMLIFTPIRVEVERVAKGSYALPDIYLAAPGGRIGQDCATYGGSGHFATFRFGERSFYLLYPDSLPTLMPVPGDEHYRYFDAASSYGVDTGGFVKIGPEYDIMGHRADYPPRTLTVDEVLREIATSTSQPAATPTR